MKKDASSEAQDKESPKKQRTTHNIGKPKVAVVYDGVVYLLTKDPQRKGSLRPLSPQQQGYYLDPGSYSELKERCISLGIPIKKLKKRGGIKSYLRNTPNGQKRSACLAICSVGSLLKEKTPVWQLLLLFLLAKVLDLMTTELPGAPIVRLQNTTVVPESVSLLLTLFNGNEKCHGKGWKINRPHTLSPIVLLGMSSPSTQVIDYCGGYVKMNGDKKAFWLPPRNMAVGIPNNIPAPVVNMILTEWPISLPVLFGNQYKVKERPAIQLDGVMFLTVDPRVMEELSNHAKLIQTQIEAFLVWLRKKKSRIRECCRDAKNYRPVIRQGRFQQTIETQETIIWSLALAVFKAFLTFSSEEKNWLTHEEAQETLLEVWRLVLPESFPTREDPSVLSKKIGSISVSLFWDFLVNYLSNNSKYIAPVGTSGWEKTIAALREFEGKPHLVLPRAVTFLALLQNHPELQIDMSQERWDTRLQKELTVSGIPFRTEGDDPTWRYKFYDPDHVPSEAKSKLPCLGIPIDQLPRNVIRCLEKQSGYVFGSSIAENIPDAVSEVNKEDI